MACKLPYIKNLLKEFRKNLFFYLFRACIVPYTKGIIIVDGIRHLIGKLDVDTGAENLNVGMRRLELHTTVSLLARTRSIKSSIKRKYIVYENIFFNFI